MAMTWTAVCLAVLASISLYLFIRIRTRKTHEGYPILGHLPFAFWRSSHDMMAYNVAACRATGWKTRRIHYPGAFTGYFISDAASLKRVLVSKQSSFAKPAHFSKVMKDVLGDGIFNAHGGHWKIQRNAALVFTSPKTVAHSADVTLPRFLPVFFEPLDAAVQSGATVDIQNLAFEFTLSHFGHIAFAADGTEISRTIGHHFDNAVALSSGRVDNPFWPVLERIFPYGKKLRADIDFVHKYSRMFVREAVERIRQEENGEKDLGDEEDGLFIRRCLQTDMTENEIADSCVNLLLAGRDTTAQAITWTLYLLLRNPQNIPRIVTEIDAIPASTPNTDLASQLPFLEACISETLRLYPPTPLGFQENLSSESILLPDGTIIKSGETAMYSAWTSGRNPQIWDSDEEDLETFRPDRWFHLKEKPSSYEWPVFHAGPRSCVGQQLARLEILVALRELLGRYDFSMGWDGSERFAVRTLTLPMLGGLPVRVKARSIKGGKAVILSSVLVDPWDPVHGIATTNTR